MPITLREKKELDQLYADHHGEFGGLKEDYFALLYLMRKFKLSPEEAAYQVAFGNHDYGIDAYYVDRDARNLYLYQFKWSENHNLFKDSLDRLIGDGIDRIFGDAPVDPKKNQMLSHLRQDLKECQNLIERIYVHFIFKGDVESADQSLGLQERRESLENQKWRVNSYFKERPVEFIFRFMSDGGKSPDQTPLPDRFPVHLTDRAHFSSADGSKRLYVGFVRLMDLQRISKLIGKDFLNRNIRFELPKENNPNRKIREALTRIAITGSDPADTFAFHHNGITLAAAKVEFGDDGIAWLQIPRLLNGAQTVSSLKRFIEDNEKNPALKKNEERLESIRVLAKIVEHDPKSDFVTGVTLSNNQQNPVHPWNLRANDKIQCDLQDKFGEEARIYYSRQENAIQALSESELEGLGIEENKDIQMRPLAQTFLAAQGEIDRMARLPDVFTIEKLYSETFKKAYLAADVRRIVVAYKIGLMLNGPLKKIEEVATAKLRYAATRTRNLTWALLIQAVLNDNNSQNLVEIHGATLTRSVDFKNYLKQIASSKIWVILHETLSDEPYAKRVADEKLNFVRTKEFYKHCMSAAYDKWGWVKQQL